MKKIRSLVFLLLGFVMPVHADVVTIVDSLGDAPLDTQFSFNSAGGFVLSNSSQVVGPKFTLTEPTVLTEIGAVVNIDCVTNPDSPPCDPLPAGPPVIVQIHPSIPLATGGVPDPFTIIASFILSNDNNPLLFSFESVAINLTLEPGEYFAIFAPQGRFSGVLMIGASNPFYRAKCIPMGWFNPLTGASHSDPSQCAAVRILGIFNPVISVSIDIKPGEFPNPINPNTKGQTPVAILTTDTFDATAVNAATVRFGKTGKEAAPVRVAVEDVNGDGHADLLLHFNTQATRIQCEDTSASLTGQTFSGQVIQGSDAIQTAGCR